MKDSSSVLVSPDLGGEKKEIRRFPADGGESQPSGLEVPGFAQSLALSLDGSRIAFSNYKRERELWCLITYYRY